MNKKIFELIKNVKTSVIREYGFFSADKYGNWSFGGSGSGSHSAGAQGLYASGANYLNQVVTNSSASLSREIPKLCQAKEIKFAFSVTSSSFGVTANYTSFSFNFCNAVKYNYGSNGGNGTYDFTFRQQDYILNNKSYSYPQNKSLKDFNNNSISASIATSFVGSGGASLSKTLKPISTIMTVKY